MKSHSKECGAALVTGLLILVVLTLIGMASLNMSVLDEKMAGNLKDKTLAFQAAEAALRDAEANIEGRGERPTPVGTSGSCIGACDVWKKNASEIANMVNANHSDWLAKAKPYGGTINGVHAQPRYVVEELKYGKGNGSLVRPAAGGGQFFYIITARGTGGNDAAEAVLQSIYATRFAN